MSLHPALRRLLLGAAAVALLIVGTALPASAHPTLLSTTPEAGYSVSTAPEQITLVFDEPVSVAAHGVRVLNADGNEIRTSPVMADQQGRRLTLRLLGAPAAGRYVVRWQVTAQDGDVVDSGFDFAIATGAAGLEGRETPGTAGFPVVVALRWLLFLALAGALGGLTGTRIAERTMPDAVHPRPLVRASATVGLLAAIGLLIQLTVAAGTSRTTPLLAVEAAGFATAAFGHRVRWLAGVALLAVVAAEGFRNHLGTQHGIVGALLLIVHLTAASIWIGALAHLLRVTRANRGRTAETRAAFLAYARIALTLFAVVVASGTIGALLLIPTLQDLITTSYGLALSAKVAVVVIATLLAIAGRRRLATRRGRLDGPPRAEATTLVAVLVAAAILVSLPTPAPATNDLAYPPPASGPVLRLGTLAGQISVGIAASENQLEVRLRVPDDRTQLGETDPPPYRITARVSTTGQAAATITLRPCGPGCFVGPVPWRTGTNYLDLRVDTDGWHGGAAVLPVHWPAQIASDILPRIRQTMLKQPAIRIVETVTSDTTASTPRPQTVTVTGQDFLDSEPYGNPPDPQTAVRRTPTGHLVVTFGLPAEGIQVQIETDRDYRIVAETLTAPKHLTRRTFVYP